MQALCNRLGELREPGLGTKVGARSVWRCAAICPTRKNSLLPSPWIQNREKPWATEFSRVHACLPLSWWSGKDGREVLRIYSHNCVPNKCKGENSQRLCDVWQALLSEMWTTIKKLCVFPFIWSIWHSDSRRGKAEGERKCPEHDWTECFKYLRW